MGRESDGWEAAIEIMDDHSEVIRGRVEALRRESSGGVGADGAAKEQDVGLGTVDFVVHPPPRLLHSQRSPLRLAQQLPLRQDFLVDLLRQHHVPVFVVRVAVFLGVLYFARVVRHQLYIFKSHA